MFTIAGVYCNSIIFRLRGCYEALDGGKLTDAMVDMTGGLSENIPLSDKGAVPNNLYDVMWKSSQMNSLIGGSIYVSTPETQDYLSEMF